MAACNWSCADLGQEQTWPSPRHAREHIHRHEKQPTVAFFNHQSGGVTWYYLWKQLALSHFSQLMDCVSFSLLDYIWKRKKKRATTGSAWKSPGKMICIEITRGSTFPCFIFFCPVCRHTYIFQNKKEFETLWNFCKLFLWITLESSRRRPLHPIPVNVIPVHDCACWLLQDPWERLGPGRMGPQSNGLPCLLERIIFKFKNKYRLLHFSCWFLLTNCVH